MKRVHLFLTMLLLAIGVPILQAQVYYTGEFTDPAWAPGSPKEAIKGEKCYYFEVPASKTFKMSTTKGSWNDFNGSAFIADGGLYLGMNPATAKKNDANTSSSDKGYVCVSLDYTKVQLCSDPADFGKTQEEPDLPDAKPLYACGANFGWDPTNPTEGKVWADPLGRYFRLNSKDEEFKISINKGGWDDNGGFNAGMVHPVSGSFVETDVAVPAEISKVEGNFKAPGSGYIWVSDDHKYIQFVTSLDKIKLPEVQVDPIKYTIYFYNAAGAKYLEAPSIHLWAGSNAYKTWNDAAEKLESTGKYYNINGTFYEVWKYEVEALRDYTALKFHNNGDDTNIDEITGQTFENGKTYIYTLTGKDNVQTRPLVDKPAESKTFTIYFLNSPYVQSTVKLDNPKVHLWVDDTHPYQAWNDAAASMTSTKQYYLIDNQYYPVWKYTVTSNLDLKNLLFYESDSKKGADITNQTFENGKSYIYNIEGLGSNQNRQLVDKVLTNKMEVYIVGNCEELGGWETLPTFKFSGPYADGSYRFDRPQMETGSKHAFKIIVRKYKNETEYDQTWIGYSAISGGNALEENKLGHESNDNIYFTEEANNVLFYYYPNDGHIVITARFGNDDPVEDAEEDVYLYFHTKYDLVRNGAEGAVPYAHCYNIDSHYTFSAWDTEAEKMERVVVENHGKKGNTVDLTEKYTLWRYRIPKEDVNGVNTVVFYYPAAHGDFYRYDSRKLNKAGDSNDTYPRVNQDAKRNDDSDWTKYIYTTSSVSDGEDGRLEYAQQTFLTFDDFLKLDRECEIRGGRTGVYFVGDAEGMHSNIKNDLVKADNEDGCFYFKTKGSSEEDKTKRNWFKCSWIEPNLYDYDDYDSQRYWSTFDLGLVSPERQKESDFDAEAGNGKLYSRINRSFEYGNYNQADWVMPNPDQMLYIVVDSHKDCHSVSILPFNPQPKLTLDYDEIETYELTDDQIAVLNANTSYLNENATPGAAPKITRVNAAHGKVIIEGVDDQDSENHNMEYVLTANGTVAGHFKTAGTYEMKYMPMAENGAGNDVYVRAVYQDKANDVKFHSRKPELTLQDAAGVVAPKPVDVNGQYLCTRIDDKGHEYFCIHVQSMQYELSGQTSLHYYPDFSFDDATLNYAGHDAHKLFEGNDRLPAGAFVDYLKDDSDPENIKEYADWSEYIMDKGNLGLMIHRERREDRLVDEHVTGQLHAVYPFLINPNAEFVPVQQNGPAMAAATNLDVSNLSLAMVPASVDATVSVNADDEKITTGIETVGVDTDAEVIYFNLQGIRILNPVQGQFYLRRAGNVTEKIRF